MVERAELAAWLRLTRTPEVGRGSVRRLLAAFGTPEQVFAADGAAWEQVVGRKTAAALSRPPEAHDERVEATLAWLAAAPDRQAIVTLGDPAYPPALFETADPPLLLYAAGRLDRLAEPSVAVVGSRHATPQGLRTAGDFSRDLAASGFVIVSGLALGIDGAAHEGALAGRPGATIAVVGTGLDRVYPASHRALAHRIVEEGGLMLSEYPLGTPPLPGHFPLRNRVIAGLARATLVVEAALRSGSLITARLAMESGRDVFAVPGSIHSPTARGCHELIRQGAALAASAQDILDELRPAGPVIMAPRCPTEPVDIAAADPFLEALGYDPVSLDALVARTGESAAMLSVRLLELELDGHVARLPGQLFQRVGGA